MNPSTIRRALAGATLVAAGAVGTSGALGVTSLWGLASGGDSGSDVGTYGVSAQADGGAIVTGYALGTGLDFGDGVLRASADSGSSYSAFTERLTANGTVAWVRLSSSASTSYTQGGAVSSAPDGSSVITGFIYRNNIDLGDGVLRSATGRYTLFTEKFTADGNVAWAHVATSNHAAPRAPEAVGYGVATLPDGGTVTTGYIQATAGQALDLGDGVPVVSGSSGAAYSAFAQKRAADGTAGWVWHSGGTGNEALSKAIAVLPDGGSIITGLFKGVGTDFGDGVPRTSAQSGAAHSVFVCKLTANGTLDWIHASPALSGGDINPDYFGASTQPDGTSVVTGKFKGTGVDLGDGVNRTSSNAGNGWSAYKMKMTANGSVAWVQAMPSTSGGNGSAMSASGAANGGTIVGGDFMGTGVDLGDGVLRTSSNNGNNASTYVERLDADGTIAWIRAVSGSPTGDASVTGVSARDDGGIFVSGWFVGANNDLAIGTPLTSANTGTSWSTFTGKLYDANGVGPAPSPGPAPGPSPEATPYPTPIPDPNTTSGAAPAATAPAHLRASAPRRRGRTITTSGSVPEGATSVVQVATGGGVAMARGMAAPHAMTRVVTSCPITVAVSGRVFTCKARLGAGAWTLVTQARAGSTVVASSSARVVVRANLRRAVTG